MHAQYISMAVQCNINEFNACSRHLNAEECKINAFNLFQWRFSAFQCTPNLIQYNFNVDLVQDQ